MNSETKGGARPYERTMSAASCVRRKYWMPGESSTQVSFRSRN